MRVMVIGGCGFLGAYITWELHQRSHDVLIADAVPSGVNLALAGGGTAEEQTAIEACDIGDRKRLEELSIAYKIEAVISLASVFGAAASAHPRLATEVNVVGTVGVFELARTLDLSRVVWASTDGVMAGYDGVVDGEIDDETIPCPASVYGHTKAYLESVGGYYAQRLGTSVVGLRPAFVCGLGVPGGRTARLLQELFVDPALGRKGVLRQPDDVVVWSDAGDVARAFVDVLEHEGSLKPVYGIRGFQASMREASEIVKRFLPSATYTTLRETVWTRPRRHHSGYGSALKGDVGFAPEFDLTAQVERICTQIEERRDSVATAFPPLESESAPTNLAKQSA